MRTSARFVVLRSARLSASCVLGAQPFLQRRHTQTPKTTIESRMFRMEFKVRSLQLQWYRQRLHWTRQAQQQHLGPVGVAAAGVAVAVVVVAVVVVVVALVGVVVAVVVTVVAIVIEAVLLDVVVVVVLAVAVVLDILYVPENRPADRFSPVRQ